MAHTGSHAGATAADAIGLRLELGNCQRELEACRLRMGQLERGEALLAGENRLLKMVAKGCPLTEILMAHCQLIEELSSGSLCGVLLLDHSGNHIEHSITPSLPNGYTTAICGRPVALEASPCGMAACNRGQVIVSDVATDERWLKSQWRSIALDHGLRACWAMPILSCNGGALGTFSVHWREPRSPTAQDQKLIEQTTHLAAVAIERRQTDERMLAAKGRFEGILEIADDAIISVDARQRIILFNQGAEKMFGYAQGEVNGKPLDVLLPQWFAHAHHDHIVAFGKSPEVARTMAREREVSGRRKDGSEFPAEASISKLDLGGELVFTVILHDVTERRQAEEALRRNQAYLTEAQHLSRTGSFGWKPATGELIWSEETFRIMGYDSASRPTVEMVFDRVHPQDLSLVKETMAGAVRGLSDFELEHRLHFADGSIKHVHVVARVVKDGAGDLEYVGALMDVTDHKRLENQLRSSERNLAEGQRLTKTGSWILDYKTGNTDWSVETCRIFGFPDPPPSPHYREFRARVRPEDRDGVDRGLKESFETGEPRPLKYVFILPDGTQKNIETISEPVRNDSGNVVKLMGTVMDVTERQKAEDALRASERLARGQIETLTRTLDVTARESSPDKIVEQVLRNFTTQLEAHSSSVWLRDETSDLMMFEFALEDGCFRSKANAQLARISSALRIEDFWVWPAIFRTGKPCLVEDIREGPDFPWRANLLAQGVVSVLTVPMLVSGVVTGVIGIRFTNRRAFRAEELELAQALTNQVMLAMQLIRLSEQSSEAAVIAERNRMARDIHDALAQGFTGVIVQLEAAEDAASKGLVAEAQTHLARAGQVARHGLSEARRSVLALRLKGHEDSDLCSALDSLLRRTTANTGLHADFVLRGVPHSLPTEWEDNLLRITQEAVTNALRHAQATHLKVRLHFEKQTLALSLCDNGRGFDSTLRNDGFGLLGIRERVEQMRGQLSLQSGPGAGTTIMITLPLQEISQSSEL